MRYLRRALTGVFLLSLTVALLAAAAALVADAMRDVAAKEPRGGPDRERVLAAEVVTVEPGAEVPVLRTFGMVDSRQTLTVRAGAAGRVVQLSDAMREGGRVEAGTLLARIDPAEAESALALAEADLAEAEGDLADARRALDLTRDELAAAEEQAALRARSVERQRNLADRGVGAASGQEEAEIAASSARQAVVSRRQALREAGAAVARAETALTRRGIAVEDAGRALAETDIHAPFDGILTNVEVTLGGLVAANEALAELIDPAALEVAFRVSNLQYGRLAGEDGAVGLPVEVTLDVLGVDLAATGEIVREGGAAAEDATGRELFAELADPVGLRPGDFVSVAVEERRLDGVARLPAAAVGPEGGVLVLGPEDRLGVADVEILRRDRDEVIVSAPDLAGAEVVANRTPMLGAGIRIAPERRAGPQAAEADPPRLMEIDDARRARLVAFVEASARMPDAAKARVLAQLREPQVPAEVVERIEARMGG